MCEYKKCRLITDKFWYRYIYPKNLYLFDNQKIVSPEISIKGNYSFDKNGQFYSTTTIYGYIKKSSIQESYMSLIALLNSQVLWWFLVNTGTTLANGYFRYKPSYLYTFPVPNINKDIDCKLKNLVKQIFNSKNLIERSNIEQEINGIIYNLYNLSDEEIKKIEAV